MAADSIEDAVGDLADAVLAADSVVALTGAGLSTASGIPDFRSEGGVWDSHDPADFQYARFQADPAGFWTDRLSLHETLHEDAVGPNAGHRALADLEAAGHLGALVTQNVDGLHREAGSDRVIRLHGTGAEVECTDCNRRQAAAPVRQRAANGELPPRCGHCEGVLKPAVVLFGESLPQGALHRARERVREADLLLAAGTSLTVEPAASLPRLAATGGATVAVVNLESTRISERAAVDLRADVTEVLPALVAALD